MNYYDGHFWRNNVRNGQLLVLSDTVCVLFKLDMSKGLWPAKRSTKGLLFLQDCPLLSPDNPKHFDHYCKSKKNQTSKSLLQERPTSTYQTSISLLHERPTSTSNVIVK